MEKTKSMTIQNTGASKPLQYVGFDIEKYQKRVDQLTGKESLAQNEVIELLTLKAAISWEITASGITILGGNPYANTAGLLFKVHQVAKKENVMIKRIAGQPMLDGDGKPLIAMKVGDTAIFKGIVEFSDGRVFEDIGEANPGNIVMSTIRPFANSMASRRATNRAMRLAAQFGLTSYEEIAGEEESEQSGEKDAPLTQADMEEIIDDVTVLESIDNKETLEKVREQLTERKKKLNERQIKYLARLFARKKMTYGEF